MLVRQKECAKDKMRNPNLWLVDKLSEKRYLYISEDKKWVVKAKVESRDGASYRSVEPTEREKKILLTLDVKEAWENTFGDFRRHRGAPARWESYVASRLKPNKSS